MNLDILKKRKLTGWTEIDPTKFKEFKSHKTLKRFEDTKTGLIGFVAIHNDHLGPAVGGTRMFPYKSEKEAISDVLKLSNAMTYKCALAGVPHGGGKAVIIANPNKDKNKKLLKAYAQKIKDLEGIFYTGEDVGISEDDVQLMLKYSPYFIGKRGLAGDPSPFAALSVFCAMKTTVSEVFNGDDISDKSVAIKGIGKVGGELLRLLLNSGAKVTVADTDISAINNIKNKFPQVAITKTEEIHKSDVDIFAPCALGNDINENTVEEIMAKVICGGANNQVSSTKVRDRLFKKGIIYIPDYISNAGGLINVVDELEKGGYNRKRVLDRIENLRSILKSVFLLSRQKKQSLSQVSDYLAENIFNGKNHEK